MKLGTLFIVSTHIGDPRDIGDRAKQIIADCDVVLCEDMKEARRLMHQLGISKDLLPLNEHTTVAATEEAIELLREGKTLALIPDCGTPLVADPGTQLVKQASEEGHLIRPVPGASSILAALVVSGFQSTQFTMAGFLPREKSERLRAASSFRMRTETLIFLEAPYRLNQLLSDIAEGIGNGRNAALAMDLTLPKERVMRDTLLGLKEHFLSHPFKGEFVLVVEGAKLGAHRGSTSARPRR